MKLSTTLNLFILDHNSGMKVYFDEIENYRALGFERLDCIFCNALTADSPLAGDDWERFANDIAEKSAQAGITYTQCHMPYYNFCAPSGLNPRTDELARRSVIFAKLLGAKWTVTHPATSFSDWNMTAESKKKNIEYFTPYIELAEKHGIGIALENMADFPGQGYRRSYCATAEELCDLADSFGSKYVGVCWDFGHANLVYDDQNEPLKYVGKRLKAIHVHDNRGDTDTHAPVFFGNVKWEGLMHTLVDIGYEGDFSFEVKRIPWTLPLYMRNAQWKYVLTSGEYLLSLIQ